MPGAPPSNVGLNLDASPSVRRASTPLDAGHYFDQPAGGGGGGGEKERPCCPSPPLLGMGFLATFLLVLGVAILGFGDRLVRWYIKTQVPLDDPTRLVFKVWSNSSYDGIIVRRYFYMYDLNNPLEVVEQHKRPDFRRVGPYVFNERLWYPYEDTYYAPDGSVGFRYHDTFTFDPELSVDSNGNQLSLDDMVTTINMPFIALMYRLGQFPDAALQFLGCDSLNKKVDALSPTGIFIQRSVQEVLFGYKDPLFEQFKALVDLGFDTGIIKEPYHVPTFFQYLWNGSLPAPSPTSPTQGQRCPVWDDMSVCNQTSVNTSRSWSGGGWGKPLPLDPTASAEEREHYGYAAKVNSLPKGVDSTGTLLYWADNAKMWWWGDAKTHGGDCQHFDGGAGMTYAPGLTSSSEPYVFVDCIYRKIKLAYDTATTVKGVPAMRFRIAQSEVGFGENSKCYFQEYTGIFNMTPVVYAPLLVTGNGFVEVDPNQRLKTPSYTYPGDERRALNVTIEGKEVSELVAAERDSLLTYLDVYGDAGMLLGGAARLQSNTWLQPPTIPACKDFFKIYQPKTDPATNVTSYFPETLFPVFYLSREAIVSDTLATYIKNHILVFFTVMHGVGGACLVGGGLIALIAAALWSRHGAKHQVYATTRDMPRATPPPLPHHGEDRSSGGRASYGAMHDRDPPSTTLSLVRKRAVN